MNISEFFKQCYVTNMDYRPDRLEWANKEIGKLGIAPTREAGVIYEGTNDKQWNGWIGCGLCHLNILNKANKNEHLLIFEDDVEFIGDFISSVELALDELPDDWDMLHFGANVETKIFRVSDHIGRLTGARSTHGYAVNKDFIQTIVDKFTPVKEQRIIDTFYQTDIIPYHNCYVIIPLVCVQKSGKSDIEGKDVDYKSWMIQRFNDQLGK